MSTHPLKHRLTFLTKLPAFLLLLWTMPSMADPGTWLGTDPGSSSDWADVNNWDCGGGAGSCTTVPGDGSFDDANFTTPTGTTTVNNAGIITLNTLFYDATASAYTITNTGALTLDTTGILNQSNFNQTITNQGTMTFQNGAVIANFGGDNGTTSITNSGTLNFNSGASAGDSGNFITNNGTIDFSNGATAESSNITNNVGATIQFDATGGTGTTAGSANITNNGELNFSNGAIAGGSNIVNITNNRNMSFSNVIGQAGATAGLAVITNNSGGQIFFGNQSTAGSSSITNNSGGQIFFGNQSTAGSRGITNNSGGQIFFNDQSTADNAAIFNDVGGVVDISGLASTSGTPSITIGSLESAGNIFLGSNNLIVGGGGSSGVISDGGASGGTGGSLTVTGGLSLYGINTYTGNTIISNGGELFFVGSNVSVVGDVYVEGGGVLSAAGSIGGGLFNSGGVALFTVVNAEGTKQPTSLAVNSDFTQEAGGSYIPLINGNNNSLLQVGGTATLGGKLQVAVLDDGFIPNHLYTILTAAGGITPNTTFSNSADPDFLDADFNPSLFITGKVFYLPNEVQISLSFGLEQFAQAAQTPNQRALANYIIATGGNTALQTLIANFTNYTEFQTALDQLSGATYANQEVAIAHIADLLTNQLSSRLSDPAKCSNGISVQKNNTGTFTQRCTDKKNLWMSVQTGEDQLTAGSVSGLNTNYDGLMLGVDIPLGEQTTLGAGFAFNHFNDHATGVEIANNSGELAQLGIYARHEINHWLLGIALDAGITNNLNTQRQILDTGGLVGVSADQHANVFTQQIRASYDLSYLLGGMTLQPLVGFVNQQVNISNFTETGNTGFELDVNNATYHSARSQLGFQIAAPDTVKILRPFASLIWEHEFADQSGEFDAQMGGLTSSQFEILGTNVGRESALVNAGVVLIEKKQWNVTASYEGRFASNWQANGAVLQANVALD